MSNPNDEVRPPHPQTSSTPDQSHQNSIRDHHHHHLSLLQPIIEPGLRASYQNTSTTTTPLDQTNTIIATPTPSSSSRSQSPLTPTSTRSSTWPEASPDPEHQLTIHLIEARKLNFPDEQRRTSARPYAVLQFDQTESVTQEALDPSKPTNTNPRLLRRWTAGIRTTQNGGLAPIIRSSTPNNPLNKTNNHTLNTPPNHSGSGQVCSTSTCLSNPENPVWNHSASFDVFQPKGSVFISVYDRATTEPGFLGGTMIELDLESRLRDDTLSERSQQTVLEDQEIDLWDSKGISISGSIHLKIELHRVSYSIEPNTMIQTQKSRVRKRIGINDFEVIKLIGEGSYGQVYRVRKKNTKRLYAMKVLDKTQILKDSSQSTLRNVLTERKILMKTYKSSFLVGLKFSFQTIESLHFVMDLKSGGELMSYMQKFGGRFSEDWVRFYTAEILSGLKYLHSLDIIYRDLKPENCLLDATGHVALCDFGLSKMNMKSDSITKTFCGTTEYIAPEVLLETGYTRIVDFWSLGILIFEMSVGWTPFFSEDRAARYSLILECDVSTRFPKRGLSDSTKNLINRLLERDLNKRLGSKGGAEEIESDEFYKPIDWKLLINRRLTPPFKPEVESDIDLNRHDHQHHQYLRHQKMNSEGLTRSRRSSVERNHEFKIQSKHKVIEEDGIKTNEMIIEKEDQEEGGGEERGKGLSHFRDFTFVRDTLDSIDSFQGEFNQDHQLRDFNRRSSEHHYL